MVQSLFERDISTTEIEFLGLTDDDLVDDDCDVYPENWQPAQVFIALLTQWHCNMNGREGLRYEVLPVVEERLGIKRKHRTDLFQALQIMEGEALEIWAEQRSG